MEACSQTGEIENRATTKCSFMVHQEELDNSLCQWLNGKARKLLEQHLVRQTVLKKLTGRSSNRLHSKKFLKKIGSKIDLVLI